MLTKKILNKFREEPELFFKEILNCNPEPYQIDICRKIANNKRVAISACHNVGKSWVMARIVLWYGCCFPNSKIITTAPTHNQVKNILWSEIRTAHSQSKFPLGGQMNLTEWYLSSNHFALGFTSRNEVTNSSGQGTQSSFQGFHADNLLVIFDEATGIPHNIWIMTEGMLTSANVKFITIGNPTSKASDFFKCFSNPQWEKIKLNCFDSVNLKANNINNIEDIKKEIEEISILNSEEKRKRISSYKIILPYMLSTDWVVEKAIEWGIEHPLFVSKVLGEFPDEGENVLIPLSAVEESFYRLEYPKPEDRKTFGVDIARYGNDSSIITVMHGAKVITKKVLRKRATTEVTGEIVALMREYFEPDVLVVDETGLGSGVVDMLHEIKAKRELMRNTEIRGVQFGAACMNDHDKERYINIKARMFDLLSKDLKSNLQLVKEDIYLEELPTIKFKYDSKGKMVIESKDDYKKRTGRSSPDHADSLALANYGRYDEMNVGSFDFTNDVPSTMAGNLKNSW